MTATWTIRCSRWIELLYRLESCHFLPVRVLNFHTSVLIKVCVYHIIHIYICINAWQFSHSVVGHLGRQNLIESSCSGLETGVIGVPFWSGTSSALVAGVTIAGFASLVSCDWEADSGFLGRQDSNLDNPNCSTQWLFYGGDGLHLGQWWQGEFGTCGLIHDSRGNFGSETDVVQSVAQPKKHQQSSNQLCARKRAGFGNSTWRFGLKGELHNPNPNPSSYANYIIYISMFTGFYRYCS